MMISGRTLRDFLTAWKRPEGCGSSIPQLGRWRYPAEAGIPASVSQTDPRKGRLCRPLEDLATLRAIGAPPSEAGARKIHS